MQVVFFQRIFLGYVLVNVIVLEQLLAGFSLLNNSPTFSTRVTFSFTAYALSCITLF